MIQASHGGASSTESPKYVPGEPVALFVPCYMDQFYPQAGEATVRLLARLGVPVVFPDKQTCCGQPAFNSGYWEEARKVIGHFCKAFAGQRWIVCPSGSCSAMCRVFFGHVAPDPDVGHVSNVPTAQRHVENVPTAQRHVENVPTAQRHVENVPHKVGSRVFELTEFLVGVLGVTDTGACFPHKVTLHNGCHTRRELGVVEPPLALLRNVRGLEYSELPNVEECCGFGGTFSVKMPGTSLAMGQTKVDNIVKTGAEVVVSPDVSCLMHIGGMLRRNPQTRHIRTMHIAEVLAAEERG